MRLWTLSLLAAILVAVLPAAAASLPTASTFVQCFADGNNSFHSTECMQGGFPGVPPSSIASATISPFPYVSVEVTSPPEAVLGAGADANATYWFQVTGGSVGDAVPLLFDFNLGAFSTPESSATAKLIIRTSALAFHVEEISCNPSSCDGTSLSDSVSIPAISGSALDSVTLYVVVQAPATRLSHESARAFADPYIHVDPAFPNASLYSVVVSAGVGNVPLSPVPEPKSAMLWLAATVMIGLRLVRSGRSPA